jgi:hypothetical protein
MVRLGRVSERVEHDPRLDPRQTTQWINLDDAVHPP